MAFPLSAGSIMTCGSFRKATDAFFCVWVIFFLLGLAFFKMWVASCYISSAVSVGRCIIARSVQAQLKWNLSHVT